LFSADGGERGYSSGVIAGAGGDHSGPEDS
jgi:hypothetical protein